MQASLTPITACWRLNPPIAPQPLPVPRAPFYGTLALPKEEEEGPSWGLTLDQAIDLLVRQNLDLKAAARRALNDAGLTDVYDVGLCTICCERFFSHRRQHGVTGRQAVR